MVDLFRARRSVANRWDPADAPYLVGGVVSIAVVLAALAFMLDLSALDVWTALIVALVLIGVSLPIFRWIAQREGDPWLAKALMWGLVVSLGFSLLRYFFIFVIYDGSADAGVYHEAGVTFANRLRDGVPIHPIPKIEAFPVESQRIGDVTGALYTLTGPSAYAGFFLFTYICYWGKVLIVRGFKAAVPEGDHRRFALLVLFFPSLLFWPASIGKEALMIGCLGVIVYGGALLLAPKPRAMGAVYFVGGSLLVLLVRPHVALMSILAFGVAMAVGLIGGFRGGEGGALRGRALRFVALAVLVVLAGYGFTRMSEQFDEYGSEGASATLTGALEQSSIGESEFTPVSITGPTEVPAGVVSVLFRPFPWEARNLNSLMTAAESFLLIVLLALSWRRVASLPKLAMQRPFLVFGLGYVLLFSIGFSFIGNFGILARQRVQVVPIVLVFLALPEWRSARELRRSARPRVGISAEAKRVETSNV